MSNMALDILIKKHGGKTVRTKVGDRYVVEEMRANDYNFGGEQSGHLIFRDYSTTGDGIISALKILAVMRKTQKKLSELAMILERLPQVLVNVKVREKIAFQEVAPVWKVISEAEKKLKGNGRVLVRYSGTELLARVMVEGPHKKETRQLANRIAAAIKKELG
jgi:phosphoglucosamine mutase